jgi:hypothetical protein
LFDALDIAANDNGFVQVGVSEFRLTGLVLNKDMLLKLKLKA